jgi:hypothetical protein
MYHKIITVIITILLLSHNQASAVHYNVSWDGGGNGHSWRDKDNWNPDIMSVHFILTETLNFGQDLFRWSLLNTAV